VNYTKIEELRLDRKTELVRLLNAMYNLASWLEHESGEPPDLTQSQVKDLEKKLNDVKGATPWTRTVPKSTRTRKEPQDGFAPGQEPPTQKRKAGGDRNDFPELVGDYDVVPPLENFDLDDDEASHTVRITLVYSSQRYLNPFFPAVKHSGCAKTVGQEA
jgi:hypothetical protein